MKNIPQQVTQIMGSRVVFSIAEELLRNIEIDSGPTAAESFRRSTRRFIKDFGTVHIRKLTLQDLQEWKRKLRSDGLAPKTINCYMQSVKRLIAYSIVCGYRPYLPVNAVKDMRVPLRPQEKGESPEYVRQFIDQIGEGTEKRIKGISANIRNYMTLAYLTAMRPTELLRIVGDEGIWEESYVFVPNEGKTNIATRFPRRIVLTDTAKEYLGRCKPHWRDISAFAHACRKHAGRSCHFLRHSAAQAMVDLGAQYQDVSVALGHYNKTISINSLHYYKPNWESTRKALDLLPATIGLGPAPKAVEEPKPIPLHPEHSEPQLRLVGY
jgi:integrase